MDPLKILKNSGEFQKLLSWKGFLKKTSVLSKITFPKSGICKLKD